MSSPDERARANRAEMIAAFAEMIAAIAEMIAATFQQSPNIEAIISARPRATSSASGSGANGICATPHPLAFLPIRSRRDPHGYASMPTGAGTITNRFCFSSTVFRSRTSTNAGIRSMTASA